MARFDKAESYVTLQFSECDEGIIYLTLAEARRLHAALSAIIGPSYPAPIVVPVAGTGNAPGLAPPYKITCGGVTIDA